MTTADPPVQETEAYHKMLSTLDSLTNQKVNNKKSLFRIGTAKLSLTPDSVMPLAGYGARKPKAFTEVLDSVFVRTIVLQNETDKVALVTLDLLIVHPEIRTFLVKELPKYGWDINWIHLGATHTHSSIGQWGPGIVGGLFAGRYNSTVSERIGAKVIASLVRAEKKLHAASLAFNETSVEELVYNRLVGGEGIEDPFLKNIQFRSQEKNIIFSSYSAHATCLSLHSRRLSGDYPAYFHKKIKSDTNIAFSVFNAGAVASMGPDVRDMEELEQITYLGSTLAEKMELAKDFEDSLFLHAYHLPVALAKPQFKLFGNFVLRPYLFDWAFGHEIATINAVQLNQLLIVGTPCDFSGELAVPLYEYAASKHLDLMITSFNGGYIGYVTKDEWFDLKKYETQTMNWYGKGNGAYFSTVIQSLIDFATNN